MNNYKKFVSCIHGYCNLNNIDADGIGIERTLSESSLDNSHKDNSISFKSNYNDLCNVNMDAIAQKVIASVYYKGKKEWALNAPASVDAFLIDKNDVWYFIEFKNQKIAKAKENCIKKALSNLYWLFNMMYSLKESEIEIPCNLDNIFRYIKEHCVYYIVVFKDADPKGLKKIHDLYRLDDFSESKDYNFIAKLKAYIFRDVKVVSEDTFDEIFVKDFEY